jgi:RNA polymerase sigma-70 factor (ECF subfamily)
MGWPSSCYAATRLPRMGSDPLVDAFLAAVPATLRAHAQAIATPARLQALVHAARAARPELAIDAVGFVGWVGARLPDPLGPESGPESGPNADPDLAEALDALVLPDLVLAWACARGDSLAIELFDLEMHEDIERAAGKVASTGLSVAEFRALVQDRLFVEQRRIERYAGRGALKGWLRVVLSHLVVDVLRRAAARREPRPTDPEDLSWVADVGDPELSLLHAQYGEPVRAALEAAFADLSARERNLLRLRFLSGWGHDRIGARYGVHRTSTARWVAAAHESLLSRAREHLASRCGVAQSEFASIARLVQSRIRLSVRRILSDDLESET